MIVDLLDAIRRLLYEAGRLPASEIDISFEAPTKEWASRLMRPTINIFLFDIRENTDLRQASAPTTRVNGRAERRLPPRRVDLRHMVSAHTTDTGDEHRLLWRALATLMRFPEIPPEMLPEGLRAQGVPLNARTAQADDGARMLDLWSALGEDPHPAFCYVVTAPVDLDISISAPLVLTRTTRYVRTLVDTSQEIGVHVGGVVLGPAGEPVAGVTVRVEGQSGAESVSDAEGRFVLSGLSEGEVSLRITRPDGTEDSRSLQIPSPAYVIELE